MKSWVSGAVPVVIVTNDWDRWMFLNLGQGNSAEEELPEI